jgi:hypothetical protein
VRPGGLRLFRRQPAVGAVSGPLSRTGSLHYPDSVEAVKLAAHAPDLLWTANRGIASYPAGPPVRCSRTPNYTRCRACQEGQSVNFTSRRQVKRRARRRAQPPQSRRPGGRDDGRL